MPLTKESEVILIESEPVEMCHLCRSQSVSQGIKIDEPESAAVFWWRQNVLFTKFMR